MVHFSNIKNQPATQLGNLCGVDVPAGDTGSGDVFLVSVGMAMVMSVVVSVCVSVTTSHHFDQFSQWSRVLKVTLCIPILKCCCLTQHHRAAKKTLRSACYRRWVCEEMQGQGEKGRRTMKQLERAETSSLPSTCVYNSMQIWTWNINKANWDLARDLAQIIMEFFWEDHTFISRSKQPPANANALSIIRS